MTDSMRALLLFLLTACTPVQYIPQPIVESCEPQKQEIKRLTEKLDICKDDVIRLDERCNPAYGNWKNCEQEVYSRWYHGCILEYDVQE